MSSKKKSSFEDLGLPQSFGSSKQIYHTNKFSEEVTNHFNKKYQLKNTNEYKIPDENLWYIEEKWKLDKFLELKETLNNVKSNLNNVNLKIWHQHTNFVNRSAKVIPNIKRYIKPQLVTQAWCKFHEILHSYDIIPHEGNFTSIHLCEAPGAFITSLNHYLKSHLPDVEWNWIANTLNPHYEGNSFNEMISDDRLILWTESNWYFGPDNTGNILQPEFISHFIQHVQHNVSSKTLLITADGSFDCQGNPGEQEILVCKLHYQELLTSLSLLDIGGHFVLKMFTLFECDSICLLYLLSCMFEQIHLYKPATSKEGNSEIYIICKYYKKIINDITNQTQDNSLNNSNNTDTLLYQKSIISKLLKSFEHNFNNKVLFPLNIIPDNFLSDLYEAIIMFNNLQINAIKRNLYLFDTKIKQYQKERKKIENIQYEISNMFFKKYKLKNINKLMEIIPDNTQSIKQILTFDGRIENGTFKERLIKENITLSQYVLEELQQIIPNCGQEQKINWIQNLSSLNFKTNMHLVEGKSILKINSSVFCLARLFKLLYEIRKDTIENNFNQNDSGDNKNQREKLVISHLTDLNLNSTSIKYFDLNGICDLYSTNIYISQLNLLEILINFMTTLLINDNVVLINISLFTQICVSIIVMLGTLFEKVGFSVIHNNDEINVESRVTPHSIHAIVLYNLQQKDLNNLKSLLSKYKETLVKTNEKESIVSVIPVKLLCEIPNLFKSIFEINCCSIKSHLLELIQNSL